MLCRALSIAQTPAGHSSCSCTVSSVMLQPCLLLRLQARTATVPGAAQSARCHLRPLRQQATTWALWLAQLERGLQTQGWLMTGQPACSSRHLPAPAAASGRVMLGAPPCPEGCHRSSGLQQMARLQHPPGCQTVRRGHTGRCPCPQLRRSPHRPAPGVGGAWLSAPCLAHHQHLYYVRLDGPLFLVQA